MSVRVIPIAVVLAAAGCNQEDHAKDPAPPLVRIDEVARAPEAVGGGPRTALSRNSAVEKIARARCDKLLECPSVLIDRYKTAEVCMGREAAHVENMWLGQKCQQIDSAALDTCVKAAGAEKCDSRGEQLFAPIVGVCGVPRLCPE